MLPIDNVVCMKHWLLQSNWFNRPATHDTLFTEDNANQNDPEEMSMYTLKLKGPQMKQCCDNSDDSGQIRSNNKIINDNWNHPI